MVRSNATTVEEYLNELAPDRREQIEAVRNVVLDKLPEGYAESMNWGMISWEIPLERYPKTYNKQPLMYAALASQKNYMSLYLMCVYTHDGTQTEFERRFKASGKKLNMGKSCVRFKTTDDLPMDLIADTVASTSVDDYIKSYEAARKKSRSRAQPTPLTKNLNNLIAERCWSGRTGTTGNRVCLQGHQGFESLPLRQIHTPSLPLRTEIIPL